MAQIEHLSAPRCGVILRLSAGNSVHPCPRGRLFRYRNNVTSLYTIKQISSDILNHGLESEEEKYMTKMKKIEE